MIMDKPLRKKRLLRADTGDHETESPREDRNSSPVHPPGRPSFPCANCGAVIPEGSVRCPSCNILYVDDLAGDSSEIDPDPTPEEVLEGDTILENGSMAFVHFGIDTGKVTCLQMDQETSDFGLECSNCGVVSEFCTSKCPLCGHGFGRDDPGLVALLEGLKFDLDGDAELDCPSCGEHVKTEGQSCPSCNEFINPPASHNDTTGVLTILKDRDVVFVHLDVQSGDLSFASRTGADVKPEQQRVHLDSIDSIGLAEELEH